MNGKVRDRVSLPAGSSEEAARAAVWALPRIQEYLGGKDPRRVIYVPDKLFNIVL